MQKMNCPADHPDRIALNDEVHARPSDSLPPRARISYLVLLGEGGSQQLAELCRRFDHAAPPEGTNHFTANLRDFRVRWEQHTEFTRYSFIVEPEKSEPFSDSALSRVPPEWLAHQEGQLLVANHVELVPASSIKIENEKLSDKYFDGNGLVGAHIADGLASAYTDFRIHDDGFGRFLIGEEGLTSRQRGRYVQRLLEIDTYRMLSLLTLPIARALQGPITRFESELNDITTTMSEGARVGEPELLDRLTLLQANIVSALTDSQFRFAASKAYSQLVSVRIGELRESRIQGLQTFSEFTARRLTPAMRTCEAVSKRVESASERVSRATQLLSTRVDISRENQNQKLLESMDRRAKLQLRLQQTVEGLSIAAITYYVVGLISYAGKGVEKLGWLPVDKDILAMASIPVVALLIAWALHAVRKSMSD